MTHSVNDQQLGGHVEPPRVICQQAGRYIGWPTIRQLTDGELLVVFSGDRSLFLRTADL